ncbi:MAG: DNA ligase [Aureispira sp.]|nr:DNA ligase [Aureispira sp.]
MKNKESIQIPTQCPACASKLVEVNHQLFCRNKRCPAQSTKKVEAFCKKMKLKGLGPKTIEKLGLVDVPQIFDMEHEEAYLKIGEKNASKIWSLIDNAKIGSDFGVFLSALSIPLIGDTAARKIGLVVDSLYDITDSTLREAGIGEKARNNLMNWVSNNIHEYGNLVNFNKKKTATKVAKNLGNVVITGKLEDFKNRTEASNFLIELGYNILSGVSTKVNYLICEDGSTSSKTAKAQSLNIEICTIKQLMEK